MNTYMMEMSILDDEYKLSMLSLEHEMFINSINNIYPVSEINGFEVKENIKNAAKSIKDKISEVIKTLVKKIKEVFNNIKKNIRKKLDELYIKSYYKDAKKDFKKTGDVITYGLKLLRKYKDDSELNNYIKNRNISTLDIKKVLALKDIYENAINDYIPYFEAASNHLDNNIDNARAHVSMYAAATTPGRFPELDKYKEEIELKTAESIYNFNNINYYLNDKIITDINETIDDIEDYEKMFINTCKKAEATLFTYIDNNIGKYNKSKDFSPWKIQLSTSKELLNYLRNFIDISLKNIFEYIDLLKTSVINNIKFKNNIKQLFKYMIETMELK